MITIAESGMTFGPFAEADCWVIEKSATYASIGEGVKVVEFCWRRAPGVIWLVEAKSSAPNPDSIRTDAHERLTEYINDIRDKMSNALALTISACLRRHPAAAFEPPADWDQINLGEVNFRFVLIVQSLRAESRGRLQDKLNQALRTISRVWAMTGVTAVVLNEELARRHGLLV